MKVVLLDEAQRRFEAEDEDEWWREHRDAKELFVEEFAQTIDLGRSSRTGLEFRGAGRRSARA